MHRKKNHVIKWKCNSLSGLDIKHFYFPWLSSLIINKESYHSIWALYLYSDCTHSTTCYPHRHPCWSSTTSTVVPIWYICKAAWSLSLSAWMALWSHFSVKATYYAHGEGGLFMSTWSTTDGSTLNCMTLILKHIDHAFHLQMENFNSVSTEMLALNLA